MSNARGDVSRLASCVDCTAWLTGASAYHAEGDDTARCWPCHCRALGVWDEEHQRPNVTLDSEGRIVE